MAVKKMKAKPKASRKKEVIEKKPTGRPTKYQEELHCQIARLGVKAGLNEIQIAGEIGVSESTLNLWKKEHPAFSECLKNSRINKVEEVEKSLVRRALGFHYKAQKPMTCFIGDGVQEIITAEYQEYMPPNPTAIIFYLKKNAPEKYGDKAEGGSADDKTLTIRFENGS
jgi:hypothetical protein